MSSTPPSIESANDSSDTHSIKVLPLVDLFGIGYDSKTIRKHHVSKDGKTHVIRLTAQRDDTFHGDLSLWLIYSADSDEPIADLWSSILDEGNRTSGRIAIYDLGDAKELPLMLEMMILGDQSLNFGSFDYTHCDSTHTGHIGYIVGNGYEIDQDEAGVAGTITGILANHLGPLTPFLQEAEQKADEVMSELERQGFGIHKQEVVFQ